MFSGRGYCTQPTCFPVLGAPPILVFLCTTHCRHMLCYRHWLSHQTTLVDEPQNMDHSSSILTLELNPIEQENLADCTNPNEQSTPEKTIQLKDETMESKLYAKEIEWWNEITPWKNNENVNGSLSEVSSDEENNDDDDDDDDDDYNTKGKRKMTRKKLTSSITCRSYSGECPLTFDGAFGLIQEHHQHQLCSSEKNSNKKICLYQHFNSKHGFTRQVSIRLVKAIIHRENPYKTNLFSSIDDTPVTLFDPYHKVKCPLSSRDDLINTPCLIQEITRKSIRRHLSGVHRLDQGTINRLIKEMIK